MDRKLMIDSLSEFSSITLPILESVNAKLVAEIGAEHSGNSKTLHEWLASRDGKLISIDPALSPEFTNWINETKGVVTHIPKLSVDAILEVGAVDAWFIDGDHNWYTVYVELNLIYGATRNVARPILIFLHDVAWPCGRRDFYANPETIPADFCKPHTRDMGVHLNSKGIVEGAFRGRGNQAVALEEGGVRNGVLTAVEDFVAQYPTEFFWGYIPAIFGLGVLFDRNHPQATEISKILAPLNANPLLAKMEENRILNFLKGMEVDLKV